MDYKNYEIIEDDDSKIIEVFALLLGVTPAQIIEKNKSRQITNIRQLYCKLRHEMHGANCSVIGREIDRTHAAVRKGVMRINKQILKKDKNVLSMWQRVKHIPEIFVHPRWYY